MKWLIFSGMQIVFAILDSNVYNSSQIPNKAGRPKSPPIAWSVGTLHISGNQSLSSMSTETMTNLVYRVRINAHSYIYSLDCVTSQDRFTGMIAIAGTPKNPRGPPVRRYSRI